MPFTIGKVFSDEAVSSLQRERQMQQDNAARVYQLELQRRAQIQDTKMGRAELALKRDAMAGDAEERQLRLELARENQTGETQDRELRRALGLGELAMSRSRVESDAEDRALRKSLGESEISARTRSIDLNAQGQELDKRRIVEMEKSGEFDRTVVKPRELDLKAKEIERKQDYDTVRSGKIAAEVENLRSRTNLNQTTATKLLKDAELDTFDAMTKRLNALVDNYKAATNIDNVNAKQAAMEAAEAEVVQFLHVIQTASPAAYQQLMKQGGPETASASGNGMFSHTGYGAAGVSLDDFISRFASGEKPPQLPKGR